MTLIIAVALTAILSVSAHDSALIRTITPVVDLHRTSTGLVRIYTQDFDAYNADPSRDAWIHATPTIARDTSTYSVRRIGRVLHLGTTVLAGGHVISVSSGQPRSAILRSTDEGASFSLVEVGTDTLAAADDLRMTQDGILFFLDRVGRVWQSRDQGATWTMTTLPKPIPPAGARELDMINAQLGICVDVARDFHFTANGWQTVITPMVSKRPIVRTQPTFLDYFAWNRELTFWQNTLILREGRDIFRSPSNDLLWERWSDVMTFSVALDRSKIVWWDVQGRLWSAPSFDAAPTKIADNVFQPDLIHVDGDVVITYRSDTGPVVFSGGRSTMLRPYHPTEVLKVPSFATNGKKGTNWGVKNVLPGAVVVDILKQDKAGGWHRDTILPIGPTHTVRQVGKDTVVFGDFSNKHSYDVKTRRVAPYHVTTPLADFLQAPVVRFRCQVAADELDSTHVKWTEFRLVDGVFRCAELVDSSRFGVRSDLVDIRIEPTEIEALLKRVNARGDQGPGDDFVTITPELRTEFDRMLDTIATLSPETRAAAMVAWRRVPKDEFSRYVMEFQNRSGHYVSFSVEREDEAHPPLITPWVGSASGWNWHVFDRGLTQLFLKAVPSDALPDVFEDMARAPWYLAAIGSYMDGLKNSRWHRWTNREVTPDARQ